MIEPAAYGAAVCFGPNTRNFRDTVAALLDNDAAQVVTDVDSLAATLIEWLTDRDAAAAMGRRAQEFVLSQQGATERTLDCLCGSEEQATAQRAA
ncbi:MAG: 3-deoxy-D-manno-octulosonic acid transferase [Planctomycetota bacterium]|jgi:3-deoxy-D-manno-octulosonic-acid transferase